MATTQSEDAMTVSSMGRSVASNGTADQDGRQEVPRPRGLGHRRLGSTNSLSSLDAPEDITTLMAENLELKKIVDSLKYFDDPDLLSSKEKSIIKHTFCGIAGPGGGLRVNEFKLLNDRLGTNIQDEDGPEIMADLGIGPEETISVDNFIKCQALAQVDFSAGGTPTRTTDSHLKISRAIASTWSEGCR